MSRTKSETYANIKNLFTMAIFAGFSFFLCSIWRKRTAVEAYLRNNLCLRLIQVKYPTFHSPAGSWCLK